MVSLNGTNTVFLGDLAKSGGEQLMADHDLSALKCDIVQVAHHGQNGVGYEVYKALRPSVALWPTPQWLWDNEDVYKRQEYDKGPRPPHHLVDLL